MKEIKIHSFDLDKLKNIGEKIEDKTGDLKDDEKKIITEVLNPKSIYLIADEVLRCCR